MGLEGVDGWRKGQYWADGRYWNLIGLFEALDSGELE